MNTEILQGYEDAATNGDFIERVAALSSAKVLAPVIEHVPQLPSRILDIGAGTGRDAAWLASLGHAVVAVEPVKALRNAGIARHKSPKISWVDDTLPRLSRTLTLGKTFDIILLGAVWQHLNDSDRLVALSTLRHLSSDNGRIIMSIRHGPGASTRPVFPARVSETVTWAGLRGFSKLSEVSTPSIQQQNHQAGVTWTWLVLRARPTGP